MFCVTDFLSVELIIAILFSIALFGALFTMLQTSDTTTSQCCSYDLKFVIS